MTVPVQITSRHIDLTEQTVSRINRRARSFIRHRKDIVRFHVVVDTPHRRRRKGRRFLVRVSATVPDGVLVSDRRSSIGVEHDNLEAALSNAFKALRRQLASKPKRRCCEGDRRARRSWRHPRSWEEVGAPSSDRWLSAH